MADPTPAAPTANPTPTPSAAPSGGPTPVFVPKSQQNRFLKPLLVIFLLIAAAAGGYFGNDFFAPTQPSTPLPVVTSKPVEKPEEAEIDLPVIIFQPDTFTAEEKTELTAKLINPEIDYETDLAVQSEDRELVAYVVEKMAEPAAGYKYKVSKFYTNNGWGGFLYGNAETGAIDLWIPSCMGQCKFSDDYRKKHPEVIEAYNKSVAPAPQP